MTISYSAKSASIRAAKKALGPEAVPGADFVVKLSDDPQHRGRWVWKECRPAAMAHPDEHKAYAERVEGRDSAALDKARAEKLASANVEDRNAPAGAVAAPPKARVSAKMTAALEAARRGELPVAPDFSAETHKRFRPRLAEAVKLAEAGDLVALRAFHINPISTSPKAIMRYRDLAIIALEASGS